MICNSEVTESKSFKLLRMTIDIDLKWKGHIYGKGVLLSSLNQRLFTKKDYQNSFTKQVKKLADSIWVFKLRDELQLYSDVRITNKPPTSQFLEELQESQNKLLRALTGRKVSDKIKIVEMFKSLQMMSVNQIAAQLKLIEV
jgi:hypothetical protein